MKEKQNLFYLEIKLHGATLVSKKTEVSSKTVESLEEGVRRSPRVIHLSTEAKPQHALPAEFQLVLLDQRTEGDPLHGNATVSAKCCKSGIKFVNKTGSTFLMRL